MTTSRTATKTGGVPCYKTIQPDLTERYILIFGGGDNSIMEHAKSAKQNCRLKESTTPCNRNFAFSTTFGTFRKRQKRSEQMVEGDNRGSHITAKFFGITLPRQRERLKIPLQPDSTWSTDCSMRLTAERVRCFLTRWYL